MAKSKPITIRGVTYPSIEATAKALGVMSATISAANRRGKLDQVGLGIGNRNAGYDAQKDAENILTNIMLRKHWSVNLRDALQWHLENVTRADSG